MKLQIFDPSFSSYLVSVSFSVLVSFESYTRSAAIMVRFVQFVCSAQQSAREQTQNMQCGRAATQLGFDENRFFSVQVHFLGEILKRATDRTSGHFRAIFSSIFNAGKGDAAIIVPFSIWKIANQLSNNRPFGFWSTLTQPSNFQPSNERPTDRTNDWNELCTKIKLKTNTTRRQSNNRSRRSIRRKERILYSQGSNRGFANGCRGKRGETTKWGY